MAKKTTSIAEPTAEDLLSKILAEKSNRSLIKLRFTGRTAMLTSNGRLALKTDPHTLALGRLTSMKLGAQAGEGDKLAHCYRIAYVEWRGRLYDDPLLGACIPSRVLMGAIVSGAKHQRNGANTGRALNIVEMAVPLTFSGFGGEAPSKKIGDFKNPEDYYTYLWNFGATPADMENWALRDIPCPGIFVDMRSLAQGQKRIMRTRPCFPRWSVDFSVQLNTDAMSLESLLRACVTAGNLEGMSDSRKEGWGRFDVHVMR